MSSGDDLFLYLDLRPLANGIDELDKALQSKLQLAAESLSAQAHAHVAEQAAMKLRTRLDLFTPHLKLEKLDANTFAVVIEGPARWIEDGQPAHNMLEDLLASPKAKSKKGGGKYIVIPFKHSKGATKRTPKESRLLSAIKTELKKRAIPYGTVERSSSGAPLEGSLHAFDLSTPIDKHRVKPGQQGPQGDHNRTNSPGAGREGPAGRPYLWGVRVYQRRMKGKDGKDIIEDDGFPKVERNIFTFRTASTSQEGSNMWNHPGTGPMNFLEEAFQWAKQEWDSVIAPELLRSLD